MAEIGAEEEELRDKGRGRATPARSEAQADNVPREEAPPVS